MGVCSERQTKFFGFKMFSPVLLWIKAPKKLAVALKVDSSRDACNGISNPMDFNPKISFFEYLDSK